MSDKSLDKRIEATAARYAKRVERASDVADAVEVQVMRDESLSERITKPVRVKDAMTTGTSVYNCAFCRETFTSDGARKEHTISAARHTARRKWSREDRESYNYMRKLLRPWTTIYVGVAAGSGAAGGGLPRARTSRPHLILRLCPNLRRKGIKLHVSYCRFD